MSLITSDGNTALEQGKGYLFIRQKAAICSGVEEEVKTVLCGDFSNASFEDHHLVK